MPPAVHMSENCDSRDTVYVCVIINILLILFTHTHGQGCERHACYLYSSQIWLVILHEGNGKLCGMFCVCVAIVQSAYSRLLQHIDEAQRADAAAGRTRCCWPHPCSRYTYSHTHTHTVLSAKHLLYVLECKSLYPCCFAVQLQYCARHFYFYHRNTFSQECNIVTSAFSPGIS